MPKVTPVYEEITEFVDIADKIIDRYPEVFGGIDVSKIVAFQITNKSRPESKQQRWAIKAVKPPLNIVCSKEYCVEVFSDDWESMNEQYRALLVADVLMSISPDGNGEVIAMDMKDHSKMLRTFGVDYLDNPDAPDILSEDIEWKV